MTDGLGYEDPDGRTYHLDNGALVDVRRSSPLAGALNDVVKQEAPGVEGETRQMDLSIGEFGDMLWMCVPEARNLIHAEVRKEFEEAIEHGTEVMRPSSDGLADRVFWFGIFKPAIDGYPATRQLLERCCAFTSDTLELPGTIGDGIRDSMGSVHDWILDRAE